MIYIVILVCANILLSMYLIGIIAEKNRLIDDMRQTIGIHEGVNATFINRFLESKQ